LEILKEIGNGDYLEPKTVYEVKISLKDMDYFQELYGDMDISFEELSEELKLDFHHRLVDSIPVMITASNGTDALAAVSMVTGEDYFLDDKLYFMAEQKADTGYTYFLHYFTADGVMSNYDFTYTKDQMYTTRGRGKIVEKKIPLDDIVRIEYGQYYWNTRFW